MCLLTKMWKKSPDSIALLTPGKIYQLIIYIFIILTKFQNTTSTYYLY